MPTLWLLSRLCEEYHCLPKALMDEEITPLIRMMEMRNYAKVKALIEADNISEDMLQGIDSELIDLVMENIQRQGNKKK